jgi:DHA1 family inner membrane transport protein
MTASPRPPLTSRQAISVTAILCVSIFIGTTSWLAPLALLPQIARGLGSSVSLVGQISSMAIFLTALAAILIGPLIRRYGFRGLFCGGIIAMVLSSAMLATASNILSVLVASLLSSVANGIIFPVALTIAATELSHVAGRRAMSYQVACVFGAVAVGMPATVLLANALGWHGAFVVLGGATVLLLAFVWFPDPPGHT